MNRPLVTIGIPVYNVEKFVVKCLQSVLRQNYDHIDILIMYDESNDKSLQLVNETLLDSRFPYKIINNTGNESSIGIARNVIIDNFIGDYLYFLDSDDFLEDKCISLLISKAIKYNAEIVKSSHRSIDENGNLLSVFKYTKEEFVDDIYLKKDKYIDNNYHPIYSWNKLFSRLFLEKFKMRYRHNFHEDAFFTFHEIENAKKVVLSTQITYNYLVRENSLTTSETSFEKINVFIDNYNYVNNHFISSNSLYSYCCKVDVFMMKYIMIVRDSFKSNNINKINKFILLKKAFQTPSFKIIDFFEILKSKKKKLIFILIIKILPFYLNVKLVYIFHFLKGNKIKNKLDDVN